MFTAPVDVIQLNDAGQRRAIIPHYHGMHDLVLEAPGSIVGHADLPLQGQGRQTGFGLRQQMDDQKPYRKRQLGLFEQHPADQRGLVIVCSALIEIARLDQAITTTASVRALKTG